MHVNVLSVTSDCTVAGADVHKSRLPVTRNVYKFSGGETRKVFDKSQQSGRADQSQQTELLGRGALKRHDTNQTVFEICKIGFAEINRLRIMRGNPIQVCNPILVVPPNSIIKP